MENVKKTDEVVCGFGVLKTYEGQKDFDTTYKEVKLVQKVKPLGNGEFTIVLEEIVTEKPIRETIQAQVDEVGLDAYLKPYELAGVDVTKAPVDVSETVQDFSMFPEDVDDVSNIGDAAIRAFNSLDPALRGNAKTIEEFITGLNEEKLNAYFASKLPKKAEENKGE